MTDPLDPIRSPGDPTPRHRSTAVAATLTALALGAGAFALHAREPEAANDATGATAVATAPAAQPVVPAGTVQLADIIERVQPAVVNIAVIRKIAAGGPIVEYSGPDPRSFQGTPFDDLLRRFFEQNPNGGPRVQKAQALGSGFLVDASGYVVTNNHVVEDADEIKVTLNDGTEYNATVKGRDPATDLALLKVEARQPLPYVMFGDSGHARVGEWVVAVGNPFGLGGTATAGIISARGRDIHSGPFDDYLQIDAPINMGNSGGPVFDMNGQVIGINTAIFSPSGGSVGIGFAIPAALAEPIVAQLRDGGEVQRGWLGVEIQDLDADAAESLGLADAKGALVATVAPDSPAANAGVKPGDVIRSFDGKPVDHIRELTRLVAATGEDKVPLEVWRDGKMTKLSAKITRKDSETAALAFDAKAPAAHEGGAAGKLGLALAPVSSQAREEYRLADDARGALIVGVLPDSPAAEEGLRAGDVIEMVNQKEVSDPQQVIDAAKEAVDHRRKSLLLLVSRGEDKRFVTLSLG